MLRDSRVYLCGAISFDDNDVEWREALKPFLRDLGIKIFDPCDPPIDIKLADKETQRRLLHEGRFDELSVVMKELRCLDLRMIDITDMVIVNIDTDIYTCGTWEEIALANRERKPILVHCKQGKRGAPLWLYGMIPHELIFGSWSELEDYILEIDKCEGVLLKRRWYLFNYEET